MPSKISERRRFVLAAILALTAAPLVAHAQPAPSAAARESARLKLREGAQQLRDGEYADALKSFERAYDFVPSPKIFFNFGLAYQGLARYAEALDQFQRFEAEARDASRENLAQARDFIRDLRGKVAFVTVHCDRSGADMAVDGRARGKTPQPRPFAVDPGPHQLVVELEGRTSTRSFTAQAGTPVELSVSLQEPPPPPPPARPTLRPAPPAEPVGGLRAEPPPPAEAAPFYTRPWVWVVAGVVVAGAVTAAVVLGRHKEYPSSTLGQRTVPE